MKPVQAQGLPSRPNDESIGLPEKLLVIISWVLVIVTFPVSMLVCFRPIQQFQRVVIFRNGRIKSQKAFGPGLVFFLPCVDELSFVDLRTICYCVPLQEALTKDALTVTVDAVVFYKVFKPIDAIMRIADADAATHMLAQTSLRNAIGHRLINELLSDRKAIGADVFEHMKEATHYWGIDVIRVEIKEVCMPVELQRAMAAEAESSRLANAKIIVADSEIEATKALDKATELLSSNPFSMQLRYLQSLHTIAGDKTHTYVVPIAPRLYKNLFH